MKLDIEPETFQSFSNQKKKKYVAKLLIKESGSVPVVADKVPLAFVMAGLPGAGKTEFLDTLSELIAELGYPNFVRIDLDQIVTVYPDYTPKDYYKFRSSANTVLAGCVDIALHDRHNMMIDGTFSGKSGATVNTIGRLLDAGYKVILVYLYDDAGTAWDYTKKRETETQRGVDIVGFKEACVNIVVNLNDAKSRYQDNDNFDLVAVVQNRLRNKDYDITTEISEVDNILNKPYNISEIKD